jgi:hypothetical protein
MIMTLARVCRSENETRRSTIDRLENPIVAPGLIQLLLIISIILLYSIITQDYIKYQTIYGSIFR